MVLSNLFATYDILVIGHTSNLLVLGVLYENGLMFLLLFLFSYNEVNKLKKFVTQKGFLMILNRARVFVSCFFSPRL